MLANIVRLQLSRVQKRIAENHRVRFEYDDAAVKQIIARCTEVESGGRMIDAILTNTVLPTLSQEILRRTLEAKTLSRISISAAEGDFRYEYAD
jgi:type VI secretion system protein VasG